MPAKKEISLLPEEENINSFSARFIRWLTTAGRFVIVFTELILVFAFISRFWLDRKNNDLSESIRQQKAIIESTSQFEKDYNLLQKRLSVIKDFYANQPEYQSKIKSLTESTPPDITYSSLNINRDRQTNKIQASVNLIAFNENSIVDYISNLILNPTIASVTVNNIEKKPKDVKYTVSIALVFKTDQNGTRQ